MKKKLLMIIFLIVILFMNGCFSYRDMNRLFFTTMGVFDINDEGDVVIYGELFTTSRSETEKGGVETKVILKGTGKTVLEAFYDYQSSSTFPVAYDVNKVLVYSEKVARHGLDDYIDSPSRNQKPTIKEFMFVSKEDPEEILNLQLTEEQFIGNFLDNMMIFQGNMPDIEPIRLNEFLNNRLMGSEVNLIPLISICEDNPQPRLSVHGAAVMINDKMVDELTPEEVTTYKFLMGTIKTASFDIDNPEEEGAMVALDNLSTKTKREVTIHDGKVYVDFTIKSIVTFEEAQQEITLLDENIRKKVEELAKKFIEEKCEVLFKKFQAKNIDLFNIETDIYKKYPNETIPNYLQNLEVSIKVDIELEGSQNTSNSYK
ncbi:MAG: Ger(x)C family spore germination protein [Eubacteriales bacterium]